MPELVLGVREAIAAGPTQLLHLASMMATLHDERTLDPFDRSGPADGPTTDDRFDTLMESFAFGAFADTVALLRVCAHLAVTEAQRSVAEQWLARSPVVEDQLPWWVAQLGEATITGGAVLIEVGGDYESVFVEASIGHEVLTASLKVSGNSGFAADDGIVVPAPLHEVTALAETEFDADEYTLDPLLPADATALVRDAIDNGARLYPPVETDDWPTLRPLFDWLVRLGPVAESSRYLTEWDDDANEQLTEDLTARFLASGPGRDAARSGATVNLDPLLWFATGYGHARPLVWGPERVEIVLLDWFPRKVMQPVDLSASFPQLVRAFVEFAHAETGVPASVTGEVVEVIDELTGEFRALIGHESRAVGPMALLEQMGLGGDSGAGQPGAGQAGAGLGASGASPLWKHGSWLRDNVAERVGDEHLDDIPLGPLPVEAFDDSGLEIDLVDALAQWVQLIEACCAALLDDEHRTACFRLLRRVADAKPALFLRGSSVERGVLALVWTVCSNNDTFDHGVGSHEVFVADLCEFFEAPASGHTARADTMLKAIGRPRVFGRVGLGDPALLTAAARARLRAMAVRG